jgi:hypothetical protein
LTLAWTHLFKGWLYAPREVAECKCSFYHGLNNVAMTLVMNFVLFFLLFKFLRTCKCPSCLLDTLFKRWLSAPKEVAKCKCGFYYGLNNVAMTLAMNFVFFFYHLNSWELANVPLVYCLYAHVQVTLLWQYVVSHKI